MASYLWNPAPASVYDERGRIADGARVYFYLADTSEPLTAYQDYAITTPHEWPVVADFNGVFPPIYLDFVDFRVRTTTSYDYPLRDIFHVGNPAPPSSGGGGGVVVSSDQIASTGDVKWRPSGGSITGWVRSNGRTIGNATSGGTERQNNDCQNLFTFLWTEFNNGQCPVSGGRGSSAAADWAANKTIGTLDMRGLTLVGSDNMGASAANKIQASTTCSATNGSTDITVASVSNIGRLMFAIIDGVGAGLITAISGTTITLNVPYAGATGSGKSVRFSYFQDSQTLGQIGGIQNFSQTGAEVGAHTHGVIDPGHHHGLSFVNSYAPGASGAVSGGGSAGVTADAATGITIGYSGNSLPIPNIQPGIIGTIYMKL